MYFLLGSWKWVQTLVVVYYAFVHRMAVCFLSRKMSQLLAILFSINYESLMVRLLLSWLLLHRGICCKHCCFQHYCPHNIQKWFNSAQLAQRLILNYQNDSFLDSYVISLPEIQADVLEKVVQFMEYYRKEPYRTSVWEWFFYYVMLTIYKLSTVIDHLSHEKARYINSYLAWIEVNSCNSMT